MIYTPTLEECVQDQDAVYAAAIHQNWGSYATLDEAMAKQEEIASEVRQGIYPLFPDAYPAFVIWVDNEDGTANDVIEVIDNMWEE